MTEALPDRPPNLLLEFVLGLLAPLLMAGSITDLHLARLAVRQAIDAYDAEDHRHLVTIAQIVAFALTALDNLRLSMAQDLSLSMKLKLRGNANALSRAAQNNTETLAEARREPKPLDPSLAEQAAMATWTEPDFASRVVTAAVTPEASTQEVKETPAAGQAVPPATPVTTCQPDRLHWADAMRTHAAQLRATAAYVSPAQRKANMLWVEVLTDVAKELRQPDNATTGMSKSELLRTTLMAGNAGFAARSSSYI